MQKKNLSYNIPWRTMSLSIHGLSPACLPPLKVLEARQQYELLRDPPKLRAAELLMMKS
jgi:hypothetical protein